MTTPLKRARLADPRKLSQGKLAEVAGLDQSNYCRLESGEASATAEVAQKLASFLGVPVDDIFKPSRYASEPAQAVASCD